jgi:peroxidase
VLLGRLDGRTSSKAQAENLPGPFDSLKNLTDKFSAVNLDVTDLVALSGNPCILTSPASLLILDNMEY